MRESCHGHQEASTESIEKGSQSGWANSVNVVMNESDDQDDEPLSKLISSKDNTECQKCQFHYNDPNDPGKCEDWIKCSRCMAWLHGNCAEDFSVFDDEEDFLCRDCL